MTDTTTDLDAIRGRFDAAVADHPPFGAESAFLDHAAEDVAALLAELATVKAERDAAVATVDRMYREGMERVERQMGERNAAVARQDAVKWPTSLIDAERRTWVDSSRSLQDEVLRLAADLHAAEAREAPGGCEHG